MAEFRRLGIRRQFYTFGLALIFIVEAGLKDGKLVSQALNSFLLCVPIRPRLIVPVVLFLIFVLFFIITVIIARRRWRRRAWWSRRRNRG